MTDTNQSQPPTFGTYLAVLRRRKWWVVAATLLGLAASLGYSLTQPKAYSASAQLLDQSEGITTGGSQQQITPTEVLTELQLVTSAPVKAAVVRKLGSAPSVSVAQVGATNVISVTATAASPRRAAAVANAYAKAFVNYNHDGHLQQSGRSRSSADPADHRGQQTGQRPRVESCERRPGGSAAQPRRPRSRSSWPRIKWRVRPPEGSNWSRRPPRRLRPAHRSQRETPSSARCSG